MSLNQSRFDKNELQFRKPGCGRSGSGSGSGGQQRPFFGGRGRGGAGATSTATDPYVSSNRSYKKVVNPQSGQPGGNAGPTNTSNFNAATGFQSAEKSTLRVSNAPTPSIIPKSADTSSQKPSQPVLKAPSLQSSSMSSDSAMPSTPSKGDGSKDFPLQFGSVSPSLMTGMQVPARTSSAPPNLDEQKRNQLQARRDASRPAPEIPLPSAPKQDLPRKDVSVTEHPIAQETYIKSKKNVQVTFVSPTRAHKPSTLPTPGLSVPLPSHQQNVSLQFGGPNRQIQSQGMTPASLQRPIQMGNPSQVPQPVFVSAVQHPLMQTQGIMHHGQNPAFHSQLTPQHPHQSGNVGINISTQYNQQKAGKYDSARKTVKITHPETHEELRLDSRDGGLTASRGHQNGPSQSQPVSAYTGVHPMGYYSNSYPTGLPFFPAQSSHTLTSAQLNASPQAPRFNYSVSQTPPTMPFMNPSVSNTYSVPRVGASLHGTADSSNLDHVRDAQTVVPSSQSSSDPVIVKTAAGEVIKFNAASIPSQNSSPVAPAVPGLIPRESSAIMQVNIAKKETVTKSVSVRDVDKQLGKKGHAEPPLQVVGEQCDSGVSQDLAGSSKAMVNESTDTKSSILSVSKVVTSEAVQTSPLIASAVFSGVDGVNIGAESTSNSSENSKTDNGADKAVKELNAKQNDLPLLEKTTNESTDANVREENEPREPPSDNSTTAFNTANESDQDLQLKKVGHVKGLPDASKRGAEFRDFCIEADKMNTESSLLLDDSSAISDGCSISDFSTLSGATDVISSKGNNVSKSGMSAYEATSVFANITDPRLRNEGEVVDIPRPSSSSGTLSGSSKTSMESNKLNRGKKKRKELLQKADAQGITADLYMAYKGPEEKKEIGVATESNCVANTKEASGDIKSEESTGRDTNEQSKAELDDWEDAAEIPTPKLESSVMGYSGGSVHDEDGVAIKMYSRDFLLTFLVQCTDLPEGFEITSDIADVLMSEKVNVSRSSGRIIDRPTGAARIDRRGSGMMDADRWNKQPGPVRDSGIDLAYASNIMGFRAGPGPNYGVLKSPRMHGPVPQAGGILSGPMHSTGYQGLQRNNSDADRWQRATNFNRGLISAPQGPSQVMHRAENKYEIGKISDEEEAKQRKLKGILNKLTPQNFEKLFEQVKEVNIDNAVTLTGVISQIFDKALMEPTFCEMYANFCQCLASGLPELSVDNEKITFRRLLLNKCQEEFEREEREEQANKADNEGEDETKQFDEVREEMRLKARRRMLGNIRLIGELFKKKMLTERIMHECIKKLLGPNQNPDEENIEALCKLMSTIGEMIDHPKAKEHMDAYFDIMGQLSNNMKLSSRLRFMLKDAIDLRKNKWQQRRKVEGPKKIEEVHRDAAQERQGQVSRLSRGPSMNSAMRRGKPVEFALRGTMLTSLIGQGGGFRGMPSQVHGFGGQDGRIDEKSIFGTRTLSMPLPPRQSGDEAIFLGPQGGLARGTVYRAQPSPSSSSPLLDHAPSYVDSSRTPGGYNGYNNVPAHGVYSAREDHFARNANREARYPDRNSDLARPITPPVPRAAPDQIIASEGELPEESLRNKSVAAIREYYSAKDQKEVAQCIRDLNAPRFYPTVISIWVTDSFERKDLERDMLSKLLVDLTRAREGIFTPAQLVEGFKSVLTELEETVTDAPKAPEFLGQIFARTVIENVITLKDVGRLVHDGGVDGSLLEAGLAGDIIGSVLEMIKSEQGESVLNEIRASSNLRLEDFRPPEPIRSRKLEMFI
ncbi:eukaryotic translation initiation factor 4G-like isoform X2 [Amaranthus tricolor]|uniref:eukaryotic translation initiation factor 4G-like isoform X2 n=1 Tax=Amaranthus tricolor TaxID=29722 RepID=UPI0025841ADA|nr:eukaryotic translation initiation factor 4G-like isoform X2 [Amaranthus tricolor]